MANKYIAFVLGKLKEIEALVTSSGAGDAGKIVATDTDGKLSSTVMPTGIGPDTSSIEASEALEAGDWVNIYDDAGTIKVRKADASGPGEGKRAHGFVLAAVSSGNNATVYRAGLNNQLTGLTQGSTYYLSTTAGDGTTTAPSATGNINQELGVAVSSTAIDFKPTRPIEIA